MSTAKTRTTKTMTTLLRHRTAARLAAALLLLFAATSVARGAAAQARTFATPEAAVDALVAAAKADDDAQMLAIFGDEAKPLLESGDPVADEAARQRFVRFYDERHRLETVNDTMVLSIGQDDWPFPIPLVQRKDGWRFDTARGKEEVLDRRIGANELYAIQTCLAYADAQREYYDRNPEKATLPHYAKQVLSSEGKRDGLYWPTSGDAEPSPLGELFAQAYGEGYRPRLGKPMPYHGYYYRILTAQGPHAEGGAYDYVVDGKMIGGFALVAYPAEWDSSGVMTFIVNHDGVVYQADLGPETEKLAQQMKSFDPDDRWKRIADDDTRPPASQPASDGSERRASS